MSKFKKIAMIALMAGGLLVSTNVFAAFVDGGEWHYGVGWTGTYGYSNYLHHGRSHTATVKNGNQVSTDRKGPGAWAQASITKIPPTGMEYYYGF